MRSYVDGQRGPEQERKGNSLFRWYVRPWLIDRLESLPQECERQQLQGKDGSIKIQRRLECLCRLHLRSRLQLLRRVRRPSKVEARNKMMLSGIIRYHWDRRVAYICERRANMCIQHGWHRNISEWASRDVQKYLHCERTTKERAESSAGVWGEMQRRKGKYAKERKVEGNL